MKTINEIAADYGYFTLDSIPENVKNDDYFSQQIEWKTKQFYKQEIPSGLESLKNVRVGVFAEIREQFKNFTKEHELFYIDHFSVLVFSEKISVPLMLRCDKKKFYLHPLYSEVCKAQGNTSYDQRRERMSLLKEPNKIGVFTENKIEAWVDYCIEYLAACNDARLSVENKKAENLAYIESVIAAVDCKAVERYHDITFVKTNYFSIEFELQDNGNYLRKKITFTGNIDTIIENKL